MNKTERIKHMKERIDFNKYGIADQIKGSKNIAKFMGMTPQHFLNHYSSLMSEYGYIYRFSRKKTAPWLSTPYLIMTFCSRFYTEHVRDK